MQKNDILRVRIEEINNLGFGVAHAEEKNGTRGKVIFVRDAVTDDLLDARIIKVNKSYLIAKIEKMIEPSALRATEGVCTAAGCGGCGDGDKVGRRRGLRDSLHGQYLFPLLR